MDSVAMFGKFLDEAMMFPHQKLVDAVGEIAHNANRALCLQMGDCTQVPWIEAPKWQKDSVLSGVRAHFETLAEGHELLASASHAGWLKEKLADGWKYGPVKEPLLKEHPCCVPFSELPKEQQLKDHQFVNICRAWWEGVGESMWDDYREAMAAQSMADSVPPSGPSGDGNEGSSNE